MIALVRCLAAALFRRRCLGCGAWGAVPCCPGCRARWPASPPMPPPPGADGLVAGAAHSGPARAAVHALKFGRRRDAAPLLAEALATHPAMPDASWLLVPVPLEPSRHRRRGFNQAVLLARAIARRRGHRIADVLVRTRATPAQTRLGRAARARNVAGAIACRRPLPGARVVLVDDVVTTGATAAACIGALRAAGVAEVVVAAATVTPSPPRPAAAGCSRAPRERLPRR